MLSHSPVKRIKFQAINQFPLHFTGCNAKRGRG